MLAVKRFFIFLTHSVLLQTIVCIKFTKWIRWNESDVTFGTPMASESASLKVCLLRCKEILGCVAAHVNKDDTLCEFSSYNPLKGTLMATPRLGWTVFYQGSTDAWVIVEKPMTWSKAKLYCEGQGWHLANIQSPMEQEDLKQTLIAQFGIPAGLRFWIGASRINGQLRWMDNTLVALDFGWDLSWTPRQPDNYQGNENCVAALTLGKYTWHDVPCWNMYQFICEYQ